MARSSESVPSHSCTMASAQAIKNIYGHGRPATKNNFYSAFASTHLDVYDLQEKIMHNVRRKRSPSHLHKRPSDLEHVTQEHLQRLVALLDAKATVSLANPNQLPTPDEMVDKKIDDGFSHVRHHERDALESGPAHSRAQHHNDNSVDSCRKAIRGRTEQSPRRITPNLRNHWLGSVVDESQQTIHRMAQFVELRRPAPGRHHPPPTKPVSAPQQGMIGCRRKANIKHVLHPFLF